MQGFVRQHPEVGQLTLESLAVRAGRTRESTWYEGATYEGVRLWGGLVHAGDHGSRESTGRPEILAGMNPRTDSTLRLAPYGRGIDIWYDDPDQADLLSLAGEVQHSVEELLSFANSPDLSRLPTEFLELARVKKLTIYRP